MSITFHHLPSSRPRAPVCNAVVGQPRKRQRLQQDREREQRRQVSSAHPSLLRRIRFKQTEPQATVQHRQSAHVKGIDADQVHTRGQREIVVNTIFDSMSQALKSGERIEIRGFGSFQVKVREAREGRNPKTGEPV